MPRPIVNPAALVSGEEGWDATIRDMASATFVNPYPVPQFASEAARPPASDYEGCLCTTPSPRKLWFSDGTDWKQVTLS